MLSGMPQGSWVGREVGSFSHSTCRVASTQGEWCPEPCLMSWFPGQLTLKGTLAHLAFSSAHQLLCHQHV